MASSEQVRAQMALHTCQDHQEEELDMYCRTCKKAVCSECVKAKHLQHDWVPMTKYTRELRGRAHDKALQIDSIADSLFKGHMRINDYWKEKHTNEHSATLSELKTMRSRLHELIDRTIDDREKDAETLHSDRQKEIVSHATSLTEEWEKLKKMILQLKEEAGTLSNYDIIELYEDTEKSLVKMSSLSKLPQKCHESIAYKKGMVSEELLQEMVGYITKESKETPSLSLSPLKECNVKTIVESGASSDGDTKNYRVSTICPISDSSAWIRCAGLCRLINDSGSTFKTFNTNCLILNFVASDSENLYFCNSEERSVNVCNENDIKQLFTTMSLIPTYVTITYAGDFLISLMDEKKPTRNPTSRRLLRKITKTGETLKEYEYDNDGRTPIFTMPEKSVEHYHGQICVINKACKDEGTKRHGVVYGLDPAGRVQYKHNNNDENFCPLDISSDMMGNTLILGSDNSLHSVNMKGDLLKYVELNNHINIVPYRIALYKDKLWIGSFQTGHVNIYEYKY